MAKPAPTIGDIASSVVFGVLAGALSEAVTFGYWSYYRTGSDFLGSDRSWTPLAVILGLFIGAAMGGLIGFTAAIFCARRVYSCIAGGVVGGITSLFLASYLDELNRRDLFYLFIVIPTGILIGLFSFKKPGKGT